jgi:hypothetical protein
VDRNATVRIWKACRVVAVLAGVSMAFAGPAVAAHADTVPGATGGITVLPARGDRYASASGTHLELGLLRPGSVVRGSVRVVNSSAVAMSVDVYAADGIPASNGGTGFTARTEPTHRVGAWITVARSRVKIPAHTTAAVAFTVMPTGSGTGGDEVGAIVAEPVTDGSAPGLRTVTRFAMGVYLRLPAAARPVVVPGRTAPSQTAAAPSPSAPSSSSSSSSRWPWLLLALLLALIVGALRERVRYTSRRTST